MFSVLFAEQKSFEIEYKGKKINAFYEFSQKGSYKFKISLISTNSVAEQALVIHLDSFKGEVFINDKKMKKPRGQFPQLILSSKTIPKDFEMRVVLQDGNLAISNGSFDLRMPTLCRNLNGGCAMIIEKLEDNHFRFYCNDYENDDDFDDLIFELQIIKEE